MIVAINTSFLIENSFLYETFSRIVKQYPEHSFIFIFDKPFHPSQIFSHNVIPEMITAEAKSFLSLKLWYDFKVPKLLKKYNADVFVSSTVGSLSTKIPQCLIIEDVSFLKTGSSKKESQFFRKTASASVKKAARIVTTSEFFKNEISSKYKKKENEIDFIYEGVSENFQPVHFEEREKIKEQFSDGNEYFLYSGEISLENNLLNLLKAFSFFKKRQKSSMQLVIASSFHETDPAFAESLRLFKFREDVKVLTDVSFDQLVKLTASAYAVVHPTGLSEFPSSVVEAMQCEVPSLATNEGSLPEVCGDAAIYFDPNNFNDIADKMMTVFKDENLRKQLIEKGKQQAKNFSWDDAAELLWNSILKTVS